MDEDSLRETLQWFNPDELSERLNRWQKRREELLDRIEFDEVDAELRQEINEAIEAAEVLSMELDALAQLIDLEIDELQKAVDLDSFESEEHLPDDDEDDDE